MKLRIEIVGGECLLELRPRADSLRDAAPRYELTGALAASGVASVEEILPGVFSVVAERRSFLVRLCEVEDGTEVWVGRRRYVVAVADVRDSAARAKQRLAAGPQELRALMPGKVVKLLVAVGDAVEAGQGVIIVEAMKMQNEMKSPKAGQVRRILVAEGATVTAGDPLIVVD